MKCIIKIAAIALFPFLMTCAQRSYEDSFGILFGDIGKSPKRAIASIYRMGKPVIPLLIDRIENTDPIEIVLENPMSSTVEMRKPRGLLAAYLIEWILAIDSINLDDLMRSPYIFGDDLRNYIYPQACIVVSGRRAEAEDLIDIKNIYQEWWRRNSARELGELRLEWKQDIRPLSGTRFSSSR